MKATAILFVSILALSGAANSQIPRSSRGFEQGVDLRGTIVHAPGTPAGNLMVELYTFGGRFGKTAVDSDGSFSFFSVPPGQYDIRVTDIHGNPVAEQTISVHNGFGDVQIRLPEPQEERPASGTVSIAELRHKVPSKARKEAGLAEKAWKKHDLPACVEHLQKAVEIDPEYLAAQSDLGLVYARMNQPDKVVTAFEGVLRIDPRSAFAYSILGAAKISLGQYPDAEAAARRALQIDSTNARSKYVLGMSLAQQDKNDAEALKYLHESTQAFPMARMIAAHILARHGHIAQARAELERYLPDASGADKNVVEKWIARLK